MIAPAHSTFSEADAVADLQKTVSASRISLFHQCRLKFWFRYVMELEKPKSPALHVGSSVHFALEAWNKARWRKQPLDQDQLRAAFLRGWDGRHGESIQWDGQEEEHKATAWRLVETYLRETPLTTIQSPDAVEVPVEADLSAHGLPRLVGVLDLVQAGVIIDFKSSATTPSPERAAHLNEAQTTGYAILYRETTRKRENGIEIHTLVKLKTPKLVVTALPPIDEHQQTRLFRQIESYVAGLERRDWVPSPGLHCSMCEYFNECRSWAG